MTVMMHDCQKQFGIIPETLQELIYADDILLIGNDAKLLERYMRIVAREGRKYGLLLNNAKLEVMQINTEASILDEHDKPIKSKDSIKYLCYIAQDWKGRFRDFC